MRSPLSSPRLRRIIAAYTVNRLGTWLGFVALSLAVFDHTHSALAVAALLFAWQALSAFLVPAVVARVETSQRRGELSGLYFFEALTTAALAVLLGHFWLPAVLLLAAFDGTAALAASALLRAEVARTAREQVETELRSAAGADGHIGTENSSHSAAQSAAQSAKDTSVEDAAHEAERKANAALNVAFSVTFVLGPALGGADIAAADVPAALLIDAASFLVCGALLIDLHPHIEEVRGDSVRARLHAAWRHINEAPSLRGLLMVEAAAFVFFEAGTPIQVAYSKITLHAGDRGFGLLLSAWGAGAVLGSLIFARSLKRPLGMLLSTGTFAVGFAYIGFAASPSLTIACIAALIGGIGNGVELPSLTSIVQRFTPPRLHGGLMGAVESLSALCVAIGLPLGGVLVALSSPRAAFMVVGLGAVAASAALLRLSRTKLQSVADSDLPTPVTESDIAESATAQTHVP